MNWRKSFNNAQKKQRKLREKMIIPPPEVSANDWRELSKEDKQSYLNQHIGKLVVYYLHTIEDPMMLVSAFVGNGKYISLKFLHGNKFREVVLNTDQVCDYNPVLAEFR